MNRVFDDPDQVTEDSIRGVLAAHPDLLMATDHPRVLRQAVPVPRGRVGVVTGGGSGHEPAFLGYVGPGLVDAVAIGEVFASPTAKSFHAAFAQADAGSGVACLYGNYAGDNMNVKMAVKLAAKDGITVRTVIANDDVASAGPEEADKRRGVAGEILMWKAGGARAPAGAAPPGPHGARRRARAPPRAPTSMRPSPPRRRPSTIPARSASACPPAPSSPPASRTSRSSPAAWKSASAITASTASPC